MKAWKLYGVGDIRFENSPVPSCRDGWALVKPRACGICSSDIPRVYETGTYHFPTVIGHEFSGEVISVGSHKDAAWVGKRVGVFPLIPCGRCDQCEAHHYEMCRDYDYLGSRRDGGFEEIVEVPVWNLIALPDGVSFEEAALLEPASVALHAVNASKVDSCARIAVVGTGTVGLLAALWFKKLGCTCVDVYGRSEDKRELIESCGLGFASSQDNDALGAYSVVLEAVGSLSSLDRAVKLAAPGAMVVLVGNPRGKMSLDRDTYWRILRAQLTIKGTWNSVYESGAPSEWTEALFAIANRKLDVARLITHKLPLSRLEDGLELMRDSKEAYVKVMVTDYDT